MAGGRFELAMEPTSIGLVSLNSETHMTAICDARLIYGRGWISRVFICCAALIVLKFPKMLKNIHELRAFPEGYTVLKNCEKVLKCHQKRS